MLSDDDVLDQVRRLAAAGKYRDEIPGRPGVALEGPGSFRFSPGESQLQRLYDRRSSEYEAAKAQGLVDRLPPLMAASPSAVAEIEAIVGTALPQLLRRLYLEIGNGGFGPGYGVLGLAGGHTDDLGRTLTDICKSRKFPDGLLPLCHWGCAIYSLVDPRSGEVWGFDPNPVDTPSGALFRQPMTLAQWMARWVDGNLEQPWAVQDPDTGGWRGATDDEYAVARAAFPADDA